MTRERTARTKRRLLGQFEYCLKLNCSVRCMESRLGQTSLSFYHISLVRVSLEKREYSKGGRCGFTLSTSHQYEQALIEILMSSKVLLIFVSPFQVPRNEPINVAFSFSCVLSSLNCHFPLHQPTFGYLQRTSELKSLSFLSLTFEECVFLWHYFHSVCGQLKPQGKLVCNVCKLLFLEQRNFSSTQLRAISQQVATLLFIVRFTTVPITFSR